MDKTYDFIAKTSDGVFAVDRSQTIVLWNHAATSVLGYCSREALGKHCYETLRGKDAEGCTVCHRDCHSMEAARRSALPPAQDLRVRTKKGDEVWVNLSTILVPSGCGSLDVLVHSFREVTRERELVRATREFTEIVSGISRNECARRSPDAPEKGDCVRLTNREREILGHLVRGITTEAIAEQLFISPRTVRNHITNILGKLDVHSRLEAVTYSIRNGIV